ncbi:MAG: hypothetical protein LBB79_05120 [Prevotellaceae bacterium]|jgi:uncharacterized protein (DUF433 family)|nr:hypothetical protein [Prevotellaceae bacterium]
METYHKSVLEYDDIVEALDFERERSKKRIYAKFIFNCAAMGMSAEDIAKATELTIRQVRDILQNRN